jgi:hypothetical protein
VITFQVSALEHKHSWINEEKQYFGTPGGAYDFKENDAQEVGKRLSKLQEKSEKLGRNINTRAMNLLGKENRYSVFAPICSTFMPAYPLSQYSRFQLPAAPAKIGKLNK